MIDNESLLPEADIQQKAKTFLLMKYPESTITFGRTQLATKKGNPVFQLNGTIDMKSHGTIDRFTFRSHPNRYSFNIELAAKQGTMLNYVLR